MKNKPIIIIAGEPYSIFFEIFFKSLKKKSIKNIQNPIVLIGSKKLLSKQMTALKYKFEIEELYLNELNFSQINNKKINIINVNFTHKKTFDFISSRSNYYIRKCCDVALELIQNLDVGEVSETINTPTGKLILILKNKRKIKEEINFKKELDKAIINERNKQLNQFSSIYFKKVELNTVINEK
jgi:4-hydroxythreonine-4-phosphate dehydrogenase